MSCSTCIEGSAAVRIEQTDARTFILSVPAGEHFLLIASRPQTVQAVRDAGYAACVERTRAYWAAFWHAAEGAGAGSRDMRGGGGAGQGPSRA